MQKVSQTSVSSSKQSSGISSRSRTTRARRALCGPENGGIGKEGVGKGSPLGMSSELHVLSLWRKGLFPLDNRRCKPIDDSQTPSYVTTTDKIYCGFIHNVGIHWLIIMVACMIMLTSLSAIMSCTRSTIWLKVGLQLGLRSQHSIISW